MALLEKAAGQGHVYAMASLGSVYYQREAGAYTRPLLDST